MDTLERKIEKHRRRLEDLYLRLKAGEDCAAEMLTLSVKLDGLLMEYTARRLSKGIEDQQSNFMSLKNHSIGSPNTLDIAKSS
jgi:hypothetical protein